MAGYSTVETGVMIMTLLGSLCALALTLCLARRARVIKLYVRDVKIEHGIIVTPQEPDTFYICLG